jgi:hypothetical protein
MAADFNIRCAPSTRSNLTRVGSVQLRRPADAGRTAGHGAFFPSALTRGDTLFVLVSKEEQERTLRRRDNARRARHPVTP